MQRKELVVDFNVWPKLTPEQLDEQLYYLDQFLLSIENQKIIIERNDNPETHEPYHFKAKNKNGKVIELNLRLKHNLQPYIRASADDYGYNVFDVFKNEKKSFDDSTFVKAVYLPDGKLVRRNGQLSYEKLSKDKKRFVKVMEAKSPDSYEDFDKESEVSLAAQQLHTKRVHYKEINIIDSDAYLSMRQQPTTSLKSLLLPQGILDVKREKLKDLKSNDLVDISINLLRAIKEQVHNRQMIHNDIKPANIIINEATLDINIIDYGLAINFGEEATGGTIPYLSAERAKDKKIATVKSDIFAAGMIIAGLFGNISWRFTPGLTKEELQVALVKKMIRDNIDVVDLTQKNLITNQHQTKLFDGFNLSNSSKQQLLGIIKPMLDEDPQKRPPIDVIIEKLEQIRLAMALEKVDRSQRKELQEKGSQAQASARTVREKLLTDKKLTPDVSPIADLLNTAIDKLPEDKLSLSEFIDTLSIKTINKWKRDNLVNPDNYTKANLIKFIKNTTQQFHNNIVTLINKKLYFISKGDSLSLQEVSHLYNIQRVLNKIKKRPLSFDNIVDTNQSLEKHINILNDMEKNSIKIDPNMDNTTVNYYKLKAMQFLNPVTLEKLYNRYTRLSANQKGIFSKRDQATANDISALFNNLVSDLTTAIGVSTPQSTAYITLRKHFRDKEDESVRKLWTLLPYRNSENGKLVIELLSKIDRPELRELREYAYHLSTNTDSLSQEKAKQIHRLLNEIHDKHITNQIEVLDNLFTGEHKYKDKDQKEQSTLTLFSTHRSSIHRKDTETVKKLKTALEKLKSPKIGIKR